MHDARYVFIQMATKKSRKHSKRNSKETMFLLTFLDFIICWMYIAMV